MREYTHVYLVTGFGYGHTGFFKIGVTSNFEKRLSQLNSNSPFPVSPVMVITCKSPLKVEAAFLKEFKEFRINREWFYIKTSGDIDPSICSHREFMADFTNSTKKMQSSMEKYLTGISGGKICRALL